MQYENDNKVREFPETSNITKEIKIIPGRASTKDGREFTVYKAVQKDGKLMDCKFRKDVTVPDDVDAVVVAAGKFNVDRSKRWPVLWIAEVLEFKTRAERAVDTYDDLF